MPFTEREPENLSWATDDLVAVLGGLDAPLFLDISGMPKNCHRDFSRSMKERERAFPTTVTEERAMANPL